MLTTPPNDTTPEVMLDINTTPLIDVMLVLLIMLIITIPMQLHVVNLDMPVPSQSKPRVEPVVIRIEVDDNDMLRWNGKLLASRDDLDAKLSQETLSADPPEIHVRASPQAHYETVALVLANAQHKGFKKLGIVGAEAFSSSHIR